MKLFDIDFDHELFLVYIQELHQHLFGNLPFEELIDGIDDHHQKHHMVSLHLVKDKELFHRYYAMRNELGLESMFNIIIGMLTKETEGNKTKEHLTAYLSISPGMKTGDAKEYDMRVLDKNLKSFMMYAKKKKGVFGNLDS